MLRYNKAKGQLVIFDTLDEAYDYLAEEMVKIRPDLLMPKDQIIFPSPKNLKDLPKMIKG